MSLWVGVVSRAEIQPTWETLATGGLLDREIASIELMGSNEQFDWKRSADGLTIELPQELPGQIVNGFRTTVRN